MVRTAWVAVAVLALAAPVWGQTKPAASPPAQPPRMRGFDPAALRTQILARVRTAMDEPTDDEWKLLEPKIVKVILLQMDATSMGSLGGGRGGFRLNTIVRTILDPEAPPSAVEERLGELQKMIADHEISTDYYRSKLAQLRKARAAAQEQLEAARKDLTSMLTIRQEAELVQLGILE